MRRHAHTLFTRIRWLPLLLLLPVGASAQINPGDVAILGIRGDNTDQFAWMPLVDLAGGEEIHFTDKGWDGTALTNAEGIIKYTTPPGGIPAGTVFKYTVQGAGMPANYSAVSGALSISPNGDQIAIFTGSVASPTFIFAANSNSMEWVFDGSNQSTAQSSSMIYPGLADGTNAVAHGSGPNAGDKLDNIYYSGLVLGTRDEVLAEVSLDLNWNGSDDYIEDITAEIIQAPLPVEFVSFNAFAEERTIILEWETASETDNRGFEVQRSPDGVAWERIAWVDGQGTTTEWTLYEHADESPLMGDNYYRLKQVDTNGEYSYSDIATARFVPQAPSLTLYPNPIKAGGQLQITFSIPSGGEDTRILDRLGNTLIHIPITNGNTSIPLPHLAPGVYFIITNANGHRVIERLVVY